MHIINFIFWKIQMTCSNSIFIYLFVGFHFLRNEAYKELFYLLSILGINQIFFKKVFEFFGF